MIDPQDLNLSALPWVPLKATNGFPEDPAIYFAIDREGVVQYVGRSVNVRNRWKSHHRYEQLSQMGGIKIAYLFIDSPELLPEIERALIHWFDPPLNVVDKQVHTETAIPGGGVRNKIKSFLAAKGITPYQFRKDVGIAQRTAYDLYNNPKQLPSPSVLTKICDTYRIQPSEILEWVKR